MKIGPATAASVPITGRCQHTSDGSCLDASCVDSRCEAKRMARQAHEEEQRYIRGLFSGGTFCYEGQLAFLAQGLPCRSNAPAHGAVRISPPIQNRQIGETR